MLPHVAKNNASQVFLMRVYSGTYFLKNNSTSPVKGLTIVHGFQPNKPLQKSQVVINSDKDLSVRLSLYLYL